MEIGGCLPGTLDENETIRYQFSIPAEGMFVGICVSKGYVIAYASLSVPNPNSAFYDWTLEVEHDSGKSENCEYFFIDAETSDNRSLFLAVTGNSQQNVFTLESFQDHGVGKY